MMPRAWFAWVRDTKTGKVVPRLYYDVLPATAFSQSLSVVEIPQDIMAIIKREVHERLRQQPRGSDSAQALIEVLSQRYPSPGPAFHGED
jgi:hypothetical protein